MNCCNCGGVIGESPSVQHFDKRRHYSPLDCLDVLRIERNALLLQNNELRAAIAKVMAEEPKLDAIHKKLEEFIRLNGEMRNEIALLMEYIHATEFWKIEPHDQKERSAYLLKIEKAGLGLKSQYAEKRKCESKWCELPPGHEGNHLNTSSTS